MLDLPLFSVGDTQTTLGSLLAVITVVFITLVLGRLARKALQAVFQRVDEKDADASQIYSIVAQLIIWVIGFELALHLLGIRLTTLFAAGGFFALGAGFAAKNVIENLLSGGILRLEKTLRPGDLIVVKDKWLVIERIGMRIITAKTYEGEEVMIPNSLVAQSMVENLTRDDRLHRIQVQVGVSYKSDLALVRKTLEQVVDKLDWRSKTNSPRVYLQEFGDSSVNYSVDVWVNDANDSRGRISDLNEAIWWALKDKDIALAYSQLDVHLNQTSEH